MRLLAPPRALLAFLGDYGPQAFALSLVIGFAVPWLAAPVKPFIGAIIFCFITINMMRADLPALRRLARNPRMVALALAWNTLLPMVVVGAIVAVFGRAAFEPGLLLGLAIAAAAPPLVAAPAYAILLGFSNALPLTVLVIGMIIGPVTAPLIADAVAGAAVPIDRWALTLRLAVFLFGAMAVGLAIRRWLGPSWMQAHKRELDGAGVVLFFVFAIAITEIVLAVGMADPWRLALHTALAFAICALCFTLTYFAWRPFGAGDAITLALATSLRNTGLLIATMGVNTVPEGAYLFFALMQFPIYFAPQIVKPFVAAMLSADAAKPLPDR